MLVLSCAVSGTTAFAQESAAPSAPPPPKGGGLFKKALGQLTQKETARQTADTLLLNIRENGHDVAFDEPEIQASMRNPNRIDLIIPVSVKASDGIKEQLEDAARASDGLVKSASYERRVGMIVQISKDPEILEYFHRRVAGLVFMIQLVLTDGSVYRCYDEDEARNALRNPIAPVRLMWSTPKENRVVGLGVNQTLSKTADATRAQASGRDTGSIVVFENPITFHVTFTIPLELAKSIKDIEGQFLQWRLTELDAYSPDRGGLSMRGPCRISPAER